MCTDCIGTFLIIIFRQVNLSFRSREFRAKNKDLTLGIVFFEPMSLKSLKPNDEIYLRLLRKIDSHYYIVILGTIL